MVRHEKFAVRSGDGKQNKDMNTAFKDQYVLEEVKEDTQMGKIGSGFRSKEKLLKIFHMIADCSHNFNNV